MKYDEYITQLGFKDDELKILSNIDEKCRNEFFEELSLAEDIVNPKAIDVVEAVKEIWRYYKR